MTSSMFLKCFQIAILTVMPPRFLSARFIIPMWNEPRAHTFKTSFTKVYLCALCGHLSTVPSSFSAFIYWSDSDIDIDIDKVETPIHDNIRELVTWECKEHGVKS
jgi:hypothetical protein